MSRLFTDRGRAQAALLIVVALIPVVGLATPASAVVGPASPTITTSAPSSVPVGTSITDTATLTNGFAPTGTITFNLYGPNDPACGNPPAFTSTVPVNGNGSYGSDPYTLTAAGTYLWVASYSGDPNNFPASDACGDPNETTQATQASPTLTTNATSFAVVGTPISDTATLSGGFQPTGTITFQLFDPADPTCAAAPIFTSTVPVNTGNANYTSGSYTTTTVGTYNWVASYSGDANNVGFRGACGDPGESSQVTQATPALTTNAKSNVPVGTPITDTATLSNGYNPTGTITFLLYGPNDPACASPAVFTDNETVAGNGNYTSAPYTATSGTYQWIAYYTGDANNNPVIGACGDANESSVVAQATPTLTTAATTGANFPQAISDAATLSNGYNPTGTITFKLYGPTDGACTAAPVFTSVVTVTGNGSYPSGSYTPTAPGTYRWIASYSGDANNVAVSGACGDPNEASIVRSQDCAVTQIIFDSIWVHEKQQQVNVLTKNAGNGVVRCRITLRVRRITPTSGPSAPVYPAAWVRTILVGGTSSDYFDTTPPLPGTYRVVACARAINASGSVIDTNSANNCKTANRSST